MCQLANFRMRKVLVFTFLYTVLTFLPVHNLPPIEVLLKKEWRIAFEVSHYIMFCVFLISCFFVIEKSIFKKIYPFIGISLILISQIGIFVSYINNGQTYEDVREFYDEENKDTIIEQLYFQGVHGTESRSIIVEKDFKYFRIFKRVNEENKQK